MNSHDILAAKERQLLMEQKAEEAKQRAIAGDKITRCKHGGAHNHKPVIRARQSRNYAGAGAIPAKLKDQADTLKATMASLMGESAERMKNLKDGKGMRISKRSLKRILKLKAEASKLSSEAREMLEGEHIVTMGSITSVKLIKKNRQKEHYEGAHGFAAYSADSSKLLKAMA